jgi:lysophospholipase L1-like esterase
MKNFLLALMTFLISLLASLFVAELAIRLLWVPPSSLSTISTEKHPFYDWAPRPGITGRHVSAEYDYEFRHTVQGLRGDQLFASHRPEKIQNRILILGDSFAYGIGSEQHEIFAERVHAQFSDTEVINAGANGYGQRQQLAILDTLGAALEPDLVVLMFFWNDVDDNVKASSPAFAVASDGRVIRTDLDIPGDFDPLAPRKAKAQTKQPEKKVWRRTYLYKLFKEGGRGIRHRLFGGIERIIRTPEQRKEAWVTTAELLRLLKLRSEEIGSKFLVASIPDYERVTSDGRLKGQKPINIEIETQLNQVCDDLNIEYIDLLPELKSRQSASSGPLYFQTDRHLTPDGNAAVANILIPMIEALLD